MKKTVFLLVISIQCTLLSFTSYSQDAGLEYNVLLEKNVFSGKVIDDKTKEPLAGASLFFTDLKMGAVTNNQGLFVLNNIPQEDIY
ncbi:MAG: carboxypeptidase-like regulatory domain-containing protein [Chitinophagaceae bacterium]|nr:carboxypeptidase-like regulatory domain-containing protein [Chitinophagaceae bacterium]